MTQTELDRLSIGTKSKDSDLEDGDTVIACGWARNMANLKKHGFRPVWTSSNGYPDADIPSDIMEYLDENGLCGESKSAPSKVDNLGMLTQDPRCGEMHWTTQKPGMAGCARRASRGN